MTDSTVRRPTPNKDVRIAPEAGPALDFALMDWYRFRDAKTPIAQADALVALSNSMFDLSTYHPDFDGHTGELLMDED